MAACCQLLRRAVQPNTIRSDLARIHAQLPALIALVAVQASGNGPAGAGLIFAVRWDRRWAAERDRTQRADPATP